jgi:hypothetical protein
MPRLQTATRMGCRSYVGCDPFQDSLAFQDATAWPGAANLVSDHNAEKGIVLASTLKSFAGGQPVLTLTETVGGSGALSQRLPLYILCTLGGARGTWKFSISLDGGKTWLAQDVVSSATYVIAGTGLTLNIATGTASINNHWHAAARTWLDQSGHNHTFAAPTDGQSPQLAVKGRKDFNDRYSRGVQEHAALTGDQAAVNMVCTTTWATDVFTGAFSFGIVGHHDALPGGVTAMLAAGNSGTAQQFIDFGQDGTTDYRFARRDDLGGTTNSPVVTSSNLADLRDHVFWVEHDGASTLKIFVDDDTTPVVTATITMGTLTLNRGSFFARTRNTTDIWCPCTMSRIVTYDTNLSAANRAAVMALLKTRYDWSATRRIVLTTEGDSITDPSNQSWPEYSLIANDNVILSNQAVTGDTVAAMLASQTGAIDLTYDGTAHVNIAALFGGTNDLTATGVGNVSLLISNTVAWCQGRRTAGFKVIVFTMLKRGTVGGGGTLVAAHETKRNQFNAYLRSNWPAFADALVDLEDFPGLPEDGVWYRDETHPSLQGELWIADRAKPKIIQLAA